MSTRWILTFHAIDPKNPSELWEVGIPEWLYRQHQHYGNEKALGRLFLVAEVLEGGTERLNKGWSRPGKEAGCYAYCGRPRRDFKSPRIETPAPPGMTFVVFVLEDGSIDEWTWRRVTKDTGGFGDPQGVEGEQIWPPIPK